MKKKHLFLLPLFALLIAGCTPSESSTPSGPVEGTTEPSVIPSEDSEEEIPSIVVPEEPEVTSIAEFLAAEEGFSTELSGVITNLGPRNTFTMEDATGAVAYRQGGKDASNIGFKVGDKITGTFTKLIFNGLIQAETTADPVVVAGPHAFPGEAIDLNVVGLTEAALLPYQSRRVTGELQVNKFSKDNYGTYTLTLKNATGTIDVRVDNRIPTYSTLKYIESLVAGDTVTLNGAVIGWHFGPQLAIDNASQLVKK